MAVLPIVFHDVQLKGALCPSFNLSSAAGVIMSMSRYIFTLRVKLPLTIPPVGFHLLEIEVWQLLLSDIEGCRIGIPNPLQVIFLLPPVVSQASSWK